LANIIPQTVNNQYFRRHELQRKILFINVLEENSDQADKLKSVVAMFLLYSGVLSSKDTSSISNFEPTAMHPGYNYFFFSFYLLHEQKVEPKF